MKITKDTEVAILVDGCSLKEKQLVYNWLSKPSPSNTSWLHMATTLRNGGWNDQGKKRDKKFYNKEGIKLISFKKFLKAVNPYKDIRYLVIDQPDESTLKRIKKMGYVEDFNVPMDMCKSIALKLGATYFMHTHDCSVIKDHISKERFMNLEPLTPVSPPLRFKEWDVSVEENTIKVKDKTFCKDDMEGFLRVSDHIYHGPYTIDAFRVFLKENKEELGLT